MVHVAGRAYAVYGPLLVGKHCDVMVRGLEEM